MYQSNRRAAAQDELTVLENGVEAVRREVYGRGFHVAMLRSFARHGEEERRTGAGVAAGPQPAAM